MYYSTIISTFAKKMEQNTDINSHDNFGVIELHRNGSSSTTIRIPDGRVLMLHKEYLRFFFKLWDAHDIHQLPLELNNLDNRTDGDVNIIIKIEKLLENF